MRSSKLDPPPDMPLLIDDDQLVAVGVICKWLECSHWTVYRMVKKGEFPPPIMLNRRMARWRSGDVRKWISERQTRQAAAGIKPPI